MCARLFVSFRGYWRSNPIRFVLFASVFEITSAFDDIRFLAVADTSDLELQMAVAYQMNSKANFFQCLPSLCERWTSSCLTAATENLAKSLHGKLWRVCKHGSINFISQQIEVALAAVAYCIFCTTRGRPHYKITSLIQLHSPLE